MGEKFSTKKALKSKSGLFFLERGLGSLEGVRADMARRGTAQLNSFVASQNAQLKGREAKIVKKAFGLKERAARKEGKALLKSQRAAIGATGLTSESFARVVDETVLNLELDALAIRFAGTVERDKLLSQKSALEFQAESLKLDAKAAKTSAIFNTISTVFSFAGFGAAGMGTKSPLQAKAGVTV